MTNLVLVSYLNTIPFLNGLKTIKGLENFNITKEIPADCAYKFIAGEADIALLPVGTLPLLPPHQIVSDFCIGCEGAVRTVVLMSHSPISVVSKIYLDMDSRSSSLLLKIIIREFMNKDVEFVNGLPTFPLGLSDSEAVLMIGDKVFHYEDSFTNKLDLGQAWKDATALPFVFAVWVAREGMDKGTINLLNDLLHEGIDSLNHITFENKENINLDEYFKKYISYDFNDEKKKALKLYLELSNKYIGEQ